jgi:hypothetical protein
LITSGSISSESICVRVTPGGTTASGLPGSTPVSRLFVCSSFAHAAWAGFVSSQLMKTRAAWGWGARLSSHTVLPEDWYSNSGSSKVFTLRPTPWAWKSWMASTLRPMPIG